MRILVIDQSLRHFGYSLWEDKKLIDYAAFKSDLTTEDTLFIRLREIYDVFEKLIVDNKPDAIVTEAMWLGPNPSVFKVLTILTAFLLVLSWKHEKKFKEVNIRKYRCYFKLIGKDEVKAFVQKAYPEIKIDKNKDISDAIVLGRYITENTGDLDKC